MGKKQKYGMDMGAINIQRGDLCTTVYLYKVCKLLKWVYYLNESEMRYC